MVEIFNSNTSIQIKNSDNVIISCDITTAQVSIGDYKIDFPGEYEKSGVLLEVLEYSEKLFYSFLVEGKVIVVLFYDDFEMKEEIMSFFGDVDILLVTGTKNAPKIVENIEARVVIPFGEGKDVFLNTLGQHKDEIDTFKLKGDLGIENTEFINLK
ncbi:MAG: hypothetical protein AB7E37_05365 [Candidatus Altimarinota bacterium]